MNKLSFWVAGLWILGTAVNGFCMADVNVCLHGATSTTNFVFVAETGSSASIEIPIAEGEVVSKISARPKSYFTTSGYCKGLFVGIDEYLEVSPLYACVVDAKLMVEMLTTNSFRGPVNDYQFLANSEATKSEIRGAIQAAAKTLTSGDVFVYFQSSHGADNPYCLCTYDGYYLATELGADLAEFADGVKTVVILDSCFSGGMAPESGSLAKAVMKEYKKVKAAKGPRLNNVVSEDVCFLTASQSNELSWTTPYGYSEFTGEMYNFGCLGIADTDENAFISMGELFRGVLGHMALTGSNNQHPYIYNEELADTIVATRMYDYAALGWLAVKDEKLYYKMNVVPDSTVLDIWTEKAENSSHLLTTKGLSQNFNLAKETELLGVPTKISGSFEMPYGNFSLPMELMGPVQINGHWYGYAIANGGKSDKLNYVVVDSNWLPVGKLICKGNSKKGVVSLKYSLKTPSKDCIKSFEKQNGQQAMGLYINFGECCLTDLRAATVKYAEGKKLTAKLTKEKKQ